MGWSLSHPRSGKGLVRHFIFCSVKFINDPLMTHCVPDTELIGHFQMRQASPSWGFSLVGWALADYFKRDEHHSWGARRVEKPRQSQYSFYFGLDESISVPWDKIKLKDHCLLGITY